MKKKLIVLSGFVLSVAPVVALAAGLNVPPTGGTNVVGAAFGSSCGDYGAVGAGGTLGNILCTVGDILALVVPVIVILGIVYFVWGVISYVVGSDEEAKKKGRDRMIYGIIGLAVIVAVWGLVNILINTFNLKGQTGHSVPTVNLP